MKMMLDDLWYLCIMYDMTVSDQNNTERVLTSDNLSAPAFGKQRRALAKARLFFRWATASIKLDWMLASLAAISFLITSIAMSRKDSALEIASSTTVRTMLFIDLLIVLALGAMVARRMVKVWLLNRSDAPGSRLHGRVVAVFSTMAILPPIVMAVFSAVFLEFGVETWFSDKVRETVINSKQVAEVYMAEHRNMILTDLQGISLDYDRLSATDRSNLFRLQQVADNGLAARGLTEVILIQESGGEGTIIVRALTPDLDQKTDTINSLMLNSVRAGVPVFAPNTADDNVIAMRRLDSFLTPTYLFINRDVSPKVLQYLKQTNDAVSDYQQLENERSDILLQFNIVFIAMALLILFVAVMVGIRFSSRLVTPLSNLVTASERVAKGDLEARVPIVSSSDEVGTLSRAFNRMTDQLAGQQKDLIVANTELEERRRFLEEVLAGVSAGVLGLNSDGHVFLPNRSALMLLGMQEEDIIGKKLTDIVPEMEDLLLQADLAESSTAQGPVKLDNDDSQMTLLVRVSVENNHGQTEGYVVTFDDLTEQLADQRTAAWADVARRIAHEIKNPLTPIQLSAERLKRKYSNEIKSDPYVFDQCTQTIIRQVGDLRRMVDEFSSFARMPAPVLRPTDIVDVVRQAVFLQDVAASDILFSLAVPGKSNPLNCDGRLLGQAITNLIKNAVEAVQAHSEATDDDTKQGKITITLTQDSEKTRITIEDNGAGLPYEQRERLLEPYVTTRAKGTGLGLAIVRKIVEDHGGTIQLVDRKRQGARAILTISHALLNKRSGSKQNVPIADSDAAE